MNTRRLHPIVIATIALVLTASTPVFRGPAPPSIARQLGEGRLVFSADHFGGSLSAVALSNEALRERRLPGWNPYVGMGRMLYADGYHYGLANPAQWIAVTIFGDDVTRQIALLVIVYSVALILVLVALARRHDLPGWCGAIAGALLISAPYFSQAGNFVYGCHTVSLALSAGLLLLDVVLRAPTWRPSFILAPIMGWLLLCARADVLVYFGLATGVATVAYAIAPPADGPSRRTIIIRGAVFLLAAALITAAQTIPLKLVGSASGRAVVPHMGFGIDPIAGFWTWLDTFILHANWKSGWTHRGLALVLAMIGLIAAPRTIAPRLRLIAAGGLGLLLLIMVRLLDPIFLAIGFDTQPLPFSLLADVFLFCAVVAGLATVGRSETTAIRRRITAYVIATALAAAALATHGAPVLWPVLATIACIEACFRLRSTEDDSGGRARPLRVLALGVIPIGAALLVGDTPVAPLTSELLRQLRGTVFEVGIDHARAIALGTLAIFVLAAIATRVRLSVACVLLLAMVIAMKATPSREVLDGNVLRAYAAPEVAQPYISATDFRTLHLLERDAETNGPAPYTYRSANGPLLFPMYAPLVPYLETGGGHSLAPRTTSDYSDLVNYGYLWTDDRHPRQELAEAWTRAVDAGQATTPSASTYDMMRALKKSVMIFNGDSPFLRYSATRYVVTDQAYNESPQALRIVDSFETDTLGRYLRPKRWRERYYVYEVLNAVPRAYMATDLRRVSDEAAAVESMRDASDTRPVVLLDDTATVRRATPARGHVRSTEWSPDRVRIDVTVRDPEVTGWLVVADPWFPGWTATIDGVHAELHRANFAFRAVEVPPGDHVVEMHYRPPGLRTGLLVSGVALALCLLMPMIASTVLRRDPVVP